MGTWGSGNLDNDYAWDELADRTDKLLRTIMRRAKRKASREGDEYDYTTLFVEFEILFALEAKGLLTGRFPDPSDVDKLKLSFIADWDAYIDGLSPTAEHKSERRKTILATFDKFKRICRKHNERK